jgi:hypothetical protein
MFKYVYINKDNQILNINGFKKLNGGRSLTKSQMRLSYSAPITTLNRWLKV